MIFKMLPFDAIRDSGRGGRKGVRGSLTLKSGRGKLLSVSFSASELKNIMEKKGDFVVLIDSPLRTPSLDKMPSLWRTANDSCDSNRIVAAIVKKEDLSHSMELVPYSPTPHLLTPVHLCRMFPEQVFFQKRM